MKRVIHWSYICSIIINLENLSIYFYCSLHIFHLIILIMIFVRLHQIRIEDSYFPIYINIMWTKQHWSKFKEKTSLHLLICKQYSYHALTEWGKIILMCWLLYIIQIISWKIVLLEELHLMQLSCNLLRFRISNFACIMQSPHK